MNALLRFEWLGADAVVERLGWVLVHSLWQFAIVALLAGVAVRGDAPEFVGTAVWRTGDGDGCVGVRSDCLVDVNAERFAD